MKHFDDFLDGDTSVSPVFTDKARLYEAADIIQKLQLIAQVIDQYDPEGFIVGFFCYRSFQSRSLSQLRELSRPNTMRLRLT